MISAFRIGPAAGSENWEVLAREKFTNNLSLNTFIIGIFYPARTSRFFDT